jgi:DNA-directed RNA polymerase specialized sigma24 family protein
MADDASDQGSPPPREDSPDQNSIDEQLLRVLQKELKGVAVNLATSCSPNRTFRGTDLLCEVFLKLKLKYERDGKPWSDDKALANYACAVMFNVVRDRIRKREKLPEAVDDEELDGRPGLPPIFTISSPC